MYVRRGKVIKLPCYLCGSPTVQAYHEDSGKPLAVTWLCRPHRLQVVRGELCLLGHQTPSKTNLRRRKDRPVLPDFGVMDSMSLLLQMIRTRTRNNEPARADSQDKSIVSDSIPLRTKGSRRNRDRAR
jgi:hypothetical protein